MHIKQKSNNQAEITAEDGKILHCIGKEDYSEIRRIVTSTPGDWEEISPEEIPPYTEAEYCAKVEELIRERYTVSDEFARINNILSGGTDRHREEYAAYQAYREECKARAKEELANRT